VGVKPVLSHLEEVDQRRLWRGYCGEFWMQGNKIVRRALKICILCSQILG